MIVESILGSALGGLLRLAPEVIKVFDRKNEREHELRMAQVEVQIAEKKIEAQMRAVDGAIDVATLNAVGEALKGQAEMAKAGGQWVSAISALVRPLVTYWFTALYSLHKAALVSLAFDQKASWAEVFKSTWGEQDWAIFSAILTFWFVSRVWERKGAQ